MNSEDKSPTIVIHDDSDSLEELSEYLDVTLEQCTAQDTEIS